MGTNGLTPNTDVDPTYLRQVQLEIDMVGLGKDRYWAKTDKNINKGRGTGTGTGRYLVQQVIGPLSEGIKAFVEDTYSGRPGPRAIAAKLIKDMSPEVVAYLTVRTLINRLMHTPNVPMVGLASTIASAIETEERFSAFVKEAPSLFRFLSEKLKNNAASEEHARAALIYAMGDQDIPWNSWTRTERIHLGMKMIELCQEQTGIIEFSEQQITFSGKYKTQYHVNFTPKVDEWIKHSLIRGADFHPTYLPTIIPPKPWASLQGGGYHSNAVRPLKLVRQGRKEHRKLLEKADLSKVYVAVNAIQNTPWQINTAVLGVMKELTRTNSGIAGTVPYEDIPIPPKPHDIDTNEVALREWKWAARDSHIENVKRRVDRAAQQQLMDVAERFKDEPVIYFPHNLDFRGRIYPIPRVLHPQGSDKVKALLRFAEGKPLGEDGVRWLAIHGANCFGIDKVPFKERVEWVMEHEFEIWKCAMEPLDSLWLLIAAKN